MNQPTVDPQRPQAPWTLRVLTAVWVLTRLLDFINSRNSNNPGWPESDPNGIAFAMAEVLQFVYGFLLIALVAYGLIKGSRFVWVIAFVWQGIEAGLGFVNFTINDYELDSYLGFSGIPFYGVVLPIAVAVISYVLLLFPVTKGWVRDR